MWLLFGSFRKVGVPYFGLPIMVSILLFRFRVLYWGPQFSETPVYVMLPKGPTTSTLGFVIGAYKKVGCGRVKYTLTLNPQTKAGGTRPRVGASQFLGGRSVGDPEPNSGGVPPQRTYLFWAPYYDFLV